MGDKETQIGVRVNSGLWKEFRNDVRNRRGGIRGHLKHEVEQALRAYLEGSKGGDVTDYLRRIEEKLDQLDGEIQADGKKKKDSGFSSQTESRLQKIKQTIQNESDGSPKVHNEVVEMAIRKHAGLSDPTIRRYKELLTQDNEIFPHPIDENRWFTDSSDFVMATNQMTKAGKVSQDQYDMIVDEYGTDWWKSNLPENREPESGRAFH